MAGRSLLPGAAMFEMAAAAGRTLAGTAADGHGAAALAGIDLCLTALAIPAPVVLAAGGGGSALECTVDCRADAVQLAQAPAGAGGGARGAPPQDCMQHLLLPRHIVLLSMSPHAADGVSVHMRRAQDVLEGVLHLLTGSPEQAAMPSSAQQSIV